MARDVTISVARQTREKLKAIGVAEDRAMKGAVTQMINDKYKKLFKREKDKK